jgi:hypothetical protein
MSFIGEILGEVIIVLICGMSFSFIVWKLRRKKTDFGEFVSKYGEMLAYGGIIFIALIYGLIQWWTS